jgi:hypothetical protein
MVLDYDTSRGDAVRIDAVAAGQSAEVVVFVGFAGASDASVGDAGPEDAAMPDAASDAAPTDAAMLDAESLDATIDAP